MRVTVLKLGSLFDGIGVFPLAAVHCGMEPVWASEIEARPISITKRHFPDMLHLGDITKITSINRGISFIQEICRYLVCSSGSGIFNAGIL